MLRLHLLVQPQGKHSACCPLQSLLQADSMCDCRGWVSFIGLRQKLLSESLPQALPVDVLNGKQLRTLDWPYAVAKF